MKNQRSVAYLLLAVAATLLAGSYLIFEIHRTRFALETYMEPPLTIDNGVANGGGTATNTKDYRNVQYGFTVALPKSWKGYSVVSGTREIRDITSGDVVAKAPTVAIRHPQWSAAVPRQDIPIDIYTLAQWEKISSENYSVGAAPIPPSELGRNSRYIFALPARYNFAYPVGFEEVEKILAGKPLVAF